MLMLEGKEMKTQEPSWTRALEVWGWSGELSAPWGRPAPWRRQEVLDKDKGSGGSRKSGPACGLFSEKGLGAEFRKPSGKAAHAAEPEMGALQGVGECQPWRGGAALTAVGPRVLWE